MKNIKNAGQLLTDLALVYVELRNGTIGQSQAKTQSNVAGKIISGYNMRMDYNKMVGNRKNKIAFLDVDEG